jgi:methanogenic corrinoid protein MtbC1
VSDDLVAAISSFREDDALRITRERLENGVMSTEILQSCQQAMGLVGERFENEEAFIPELMMAGEIMKCIADVLKPYAGEAPIDESQGIVVLGTVQGDIHDIGKDIVLTMLEVSGLRVIDLGVDVPPSRFVATVQETGARVVALSCLLTVAFDAMRETVDALAQAGLREQVRVMVGGAPATAAVQEYTGADGWGVDAMTAVRLANAWLQESENAAAL